MTLTFMGEVGVYNAERQAIYFAGVTAQRNILFCIAEIALLRIAKRRIANPVEPITLFDDHRSRIDEIATLKFSRLHINDRGDINVPVITLADTESYRKQ